LQGVRRQVEPAAGEAREAVTLTFKGIPVHVCEKAPKDKPYLLDPRFLRICPFCQQEMTTK
jgi:hypothetical protein